MLQHGRSKRKQERNQSTTGPLPVAISNTKTLRDRLIKDFKKTEKEISTHEESLEKFRSEDIPAFRHWHYKEFAELNKEKDELLLRFDRFNEMRRRVEMEIFYTGASVAKAFLKFEAWFEGNPETPVAQDEKNSKDGPDFIFGSKEDEDERDGDLFGKNGDGYDKGAEDILDELGSFFGLPGIGRAQQQSSQSTQARLKDIYRQLVRILHPDSNTKRTARQIELWHEVQRAYQEKDLARLEHLLSVSDSVNGEISAKTSCWSLLQMISRNKSILRDLRGELREAKEMPAWRFTAIKDRATVHWKVKRELTGMISSVRQELGRLEDLIAKWRKAADRFRKVPGDQTAAAAAPKPKRRQRKGCRV